MLHSQSTFSRHTALILTCALVLSCTDDPQYVFSSETELDDSMTLFSNGITLPIGSTKEIRLDDVIETDLEENTLIKLHEDGTFWVDIATTTPVNKDFQVPCPELPAFDLGLTSIVGHYDFPSSSAGKPGTSGYRDEMAIAAPIPITMSATAPEGICGIDGLDVDAPVTFTFGCESGAAYTITKGSKFDFPAFLTLEADGDMVSVSDGHILTVLRDIKVTSATSIRAFVKHIDVKALNCSTGPDGRLRIDIDDEFKVNGSIVVSGADFSIFPAGFDILLTATSGRALVMGLTGRFDIKESIPMREINLTGIPEYLADVNFFLYDPVFTALIDNSTPLSIILSGDITCMTDEESNRYSIKDFKIAPDGTTAFTLDGDDAREISKRLPNSIRFENVWAATDRNATVHVDLDRSFRVGVKEYSFRAPLAFAEGAGIKFQTVLEDIDLSEIDILNGAASLEMDLVSTLPMDLTMSATPLDNEGMSIPGLEFNVSGKIAAGSLDSPATTPVKLEIRNSGAGADVSQIRLDFEATVPQGCAGQALCKDNYIKLNNIRVSLPEGLTI